MSILLQILLGLAVKEIVAHEDNIEEVLHKACDSLVSKVVEKLKAKQAPVEQQPSL
jgi:hypothetical protein